MTTGNGNKAAVVETTDLAPIPALPNQERGITLFGTDDPTRVIVMAGKVAGSLRDVIDQQKLYSDIKGRKHVKVEGWTLCGSMLGVFPVCIWTRQVEGGWEARVEARLRDGSVVGAAEAQCTRSESMWEKRDDYAIRSMAQTRATSKALRLPLGFIVAMGGYDATPAEEMTAESVESMRAAAPPTVPPPASPQAHKPNNPVPPSPSGGNGAFVISDKQAKRFYAICKSSGKEESEIASYLMDTFGIDDDRLIPKSGYDEACAWANTPS